MDELMTFNFSVLGKARIQKLHGRDHFVVPMVMITEGVHEGDEGAFLYEEPDIEESADSWNHMPVSVYHPKKKGTARNEKVLNEQCCGLVLNTRWDKKNKKLRAEAWFDCQRTEELDGRVYTAVKTGKMMEVSTGVRVTVIANEGTWKPTGKFYKGKATKLRPDHLAVLPDMKGACSIKDGAGLFQLNHAMDNATQAEVLPSHVVEMFWAGKFPGFTVTTDNAAASASFGQITRRLNEALSSTFGEPGKTWNGFVEEVFPDCVIYYINGELYKAEYTVDRDGNVTIDGEGEKVSRQTVYKVVNGVAEVGNQADPEPPVQEQTMDKVAFIGQLIANSGGRWTEEDRAELMTFEEKVLKKMAGKTVVVVGNASALTQEQMNALLATGLNGHVTTIVNQAKAAIPEEVAKVLANLTPEQRFALLPADDQVWIANRRVEEATEKANLITQLTSNEGCPFTKEFLELKPIEELRGLNKMAMNMIPPVDPALAGGGMVPMYRGAQGAPVHNAAAAKNIPVLKPLDNPTEWGGNDGKESKARTGAAA